MSATLPGGRGALPLTLQLGAAEVLQDLLPVGRVVEAAQVGLQLAAKDLQGGTLADTVRSHETEHLARAGHGQAVELEAIGRVAVRHLGLEVGGQVDDGDCVEGALLWANTTTNTQIFGNKRNL